MSQDRGGMHLHRALRASTSPATPPLLTLFSPWIYFNCMSSINVPSTTTRNLQDRFGSRPSLDREIVKYGIEEQAGRSAGSESNVFHFVKCPSRKEKTMNLRTASLATALLGATAVASLPTSANAQWRGGWGLGGFGVGLAAGAIIGGALAAPYYSYGYAPGYSYGYAPAYAYAPAYSYGYAPTYSYGYATANGYAYAPRYSYGYAPGVYAYAPNWGYRRWYYR